ncbi:MAG: magnesium chelatase subunit D [Rhodoferax sp.]|nr:magnesium chelatase subunit D [Rhodoferax sp.]
MTTGDVDPVPDAWVDAQLALAALQVDPVGLGGVRLRAGHGPVRDAWLKQLRQTQPSCIRIPLRTDTERLLGGMDLSATVRQGRLVRQPGLLAQAHGGLVLLPMAERLDPQRVAQLTQVQERGELPTGPNQAAEAARFGIVALDESDADEAGLAPRLADRLGLWLDLSQTDLSQCRELPDLLSPDECSDARQRLLSIRTTPQQVEAVCRIAALLGADSLRAPVQALRLACVLAALQQRDQVDDDDLTTAARLVLAPRATRLPGPETAEAEAAPAADPPPPDPAQHPDPPSEDSPASDEPVGTLADLLLAAAVASLPPHLLDRLQAERSASGLTREAGSSGQARQSRDRGRPLPPRPGKPGSGSRLHLLATLRAAVPRQGLRQRPAGGARIAWRAEDFHVQRFEQRTPSCLIFALDASGSAAAQRLAEAKGAVELMLQQSYARRDSVCVLAFRQQQATLLLPPTRSLVRAKRALAGLPGGGGTPLAAALQAAMQQALALRRNGSSPMLVVLSDGRANVALSGLGGRVQAQQDAQAWARHWGQSGLPSLWVDTSVQPDPRARELAGWMGASYFPMPHVQAQRMASVVQDLSQPLRRRAN